jgi:hypothetical protein
VRLRKQLEDQEAAVLLLLLLLRLPCDWVQEKTC